MAIRTPPVAPHCRRPGARSPEVSKVFAKALELAQRCLQMFLPLHWVRLTPFASTDSGVPLMKKAWRAELQGVYVYHPLRLCWEPSCLSPLPLLLLR